MQRIRGWLLGRKQAESQVLANGGGLVFTAGTYPCPRHSSGAIDLLHPGTALSDLDCSTFGVQAMLYSHKNLSFKPLLLAKIK